MSKTKAKTSTGPGPGRPRDPKTDEDILRAAIELFSEHGVEGTTLQEIAKRAGVAATTLYRRWSSKEALLVDAFGQLRSREEHVEDYGKLSYDQLLWIMTEMTPESAGRADLGKLVARLIGSVRSHPELMRAYWDAHLAPRRKAFSKSLARMREEGRVPAHTDPDVLQDILAGALLYRFLVQPGKSTAQDRRAYSLKLLRQLGFTGLPKA